MKVLVTGARGLLGSDLVPELERRGHEALPTSREQLDIADPMSVAALMMGELGAFDACINCAAYTAVDKAESEEQAAYDANALGVGYLSSACQAQGIKLIHLSTDFVFDGSATEPYTEEMPTNPLSAYGRTKLAGERALQGNPNAWVVRTSWVFGKHGKCFPQSMIAAHKAGKKLRVVNDQTGCPTYTVDLARVLVDILERNPFPGIYHACGQDSLSWHEFAQKILGTPLEAIPTSEYPTPAKRPAYSVMSTAKLQAVGIEPMRSLDEMLADFLA